MHVLPKPVPIVSGKEKCDTSDNSRLSEMVKSIQQSAMYLPTLAAPAFNPRYTSLSDALQGCIDIDTATDIEYEYVDDEYDAIEDRIFAKLSSKRHTGVTKKRSIRAP
jgi:hypothetical protein